MPGYDYLYLGDNARAPYGTRSFERVYEFTLQAVHKLFDLGCPLVILACNTASAKALRSIQQHDLPRMADPSRRVLGVIRPTVEAVGDITRTRHVGIVATQGTVASRTYELEMAKLHPDITVTAQACPMWVSLVENREYDQPGADYFVRRDIGTLLARDPAIDTIILGCTHFPLLYNKVRAYTPAHVRIIPQGDYVARSLVDYLRRHPEMDCRLSRTANPDSATPSVPQSSTSQPAAHGTIRFLTTERPDAFSPLATLFLGHNVVAEQITL